MIFFCKSLRKSNEMSCQLGELVCDLLGRFMGEIVAKVASDLFTYGSKCIPLIAKSTGLPRAQVVECLRVLIKYNLATFEPSLKNESVADYKLCPENILLFLRYPRYLLEIKSKYGTEAELIIEETLQNGTITASQLILNIARKYKDDSEKNITIPGLRDILISLTNAGYVHPAPTPEKSDSDAWSEVPVLVEPTRLPGGAPVLPDVDVKALMLILSGNTEQQANSDELYWRVNFERFHQDFRDELMIKAISRRIDDNAGELMRHLLVLMYSRAADGGSGAGVHSADVRESCRRAQASFPLLNQYLDQYMKVIEDNSVGMVRVIGDSAGGVFNVECRAAASRFVWELLEQMVQQRLGHNAARIFRLIRSKKYIEESDIQRYAMLPAKESKELTYKLMEEYFVSVQPMRKAASGGSGPAKAIYLYHIDLHHTARCVRSMIYRALYNCGSRSIHEKSQHARLLDKQRRVSTIVHGMRLRNEPQENIQDMEDTITPPEQVVLRSIHKTLKQLSTAELQLDRSLFILDWYFMYKP